MAIITVSRGSYSNGKILAERVAETLGYTCVSREVILEAAYEFNIPEIKLVRAIHDAPSVLDRFTHGKARYVTYLRTALLAHVQRDHVVYHGLAGHFFLKGVRHVLKVRVTADLEDRVSWEVERENISRERARRVLTEDDEKRRKWSLSLYGIDTTDPSLYDLVVHIQNGTLDRAVATVSRTAGLPRFATTSESQRVLDDLVVEARVKSAIVRAWPGAWVEAEGGKVTIHGDAPRGFDTKARHAISSLALSVRGVETVTVAVRPASPRAYPGI
jgi:cytidylate kinase